MLRKTQSIGLIFFTGLLTLSVSVNVIAFESYRVLPGARATGMAGIFSAQADDSSAIWYNPAGLAYNQQLPTDFTLDFGDTLQPQVESAERAGVSNKERSVSYIAGYTTELNWLRRYLANSGIGIAYYSPYTLRSNVVEPRGFFDTTPYGEIDLNYQQLSFLLSSQLLKTVSAGLTIDHMWADVGCVQEPNCSAGTASGLGATIGLLFDLYRVKQTLLKMGIVWRSKIALRYSPQNEFGIGEVIADYIIDRPDSRTYALSAQIPTDTLLINANFSVQTVQWSEVSLSQNQASDYKIYGIAAEFIVPFLKMQSLSYRIGHKHAQPKQGPSPSIDTLALGFGLSIAEDYFIDLSLQRRRINGVVNETSNIIKIAYSYQK